jgi:hypothetical protein
MDDRIEQVLGILEAAPSCEAVGAAIRLGGETLYGGLRPVPSGGLPDLTVEADRKIAQAERKFAELLHGVAQRDDCPEQAALALNLKLFVEQMNEVAVAVGRITIECGVGKPCPDLVPFLDEATGHELRGDPQRVLEPGFSLKLRSPYFPWPTGYDWEEDVTVTDPIGPRECVAVFKETRGLMLRLHLERIDVVRDPWATPMLARGTKIPVFSLEWVPSQYGKTWNICNTGEGLETTVSQRIKQDIPLNFFWRYYGKAWPKKRY